MLKFFLHEYMTLLKSDILLKFTALLNLICVMVKNDRFYIESTIILWLVDFYQMIVRSFYWSETIRSKSDWDFSTKTDARLISRFFVEENPEFFVGHLCGRRKMPWVKNTEPRIFLISGDISISMAYDSVVPIYLSTYVPRSTRRRHAGPVLLLSLFLLFFLSVYSAL